jgi:uncharacterized protein (TIGR03083 family)
MSDEIHGGAPALAALEASVDHLAALAHGLDSDGIVAQSYADDWTVAQVFSHLGSGAVISARRLDDALAGTETPEDFMPSVWDAWNAKAPAEQISDTLAADRALLDRFKRVSPAERKRVSVSFGPMSMDFSRLVSMRVSEHALHTWDIEVSVDPSAVLADESAAVIVDNLEMMVRFGGKPTGTTFHARIHTHSPERDFVLDIGEDAVSLDAASSAGDPDVVMPAEVLVRLIYGRLDVSHTPQSVGSVDLDVVRRTFPGV